MSCLHPLKFGSIGKGIAPKALLEIIMMGSGKDLGNFDQWMEQLSKQIVIRSDEPDTKVPWKANENLVDDDFEEEE